MTMTTTTKKTKEIPVLSLYLPKKIKPQKNPDKLKILFTFCRLKDCVNIKET